MQIEPSGVIMLGICSVQTQECVATEVAPITAVWVKHGREQLNVCNSCLEEKIRSGEWFVEGAKVSGMKKGVDLAVFDKNNNLTIVVDIKNKTGTSEDWAVNIYDKLISYNLIPKAPFFLIILPDKAYLWKQENAGQNSQLNIFDMSEVLKPYLNSSAFGLPDISVSDNNDFIYNKRSVLQKHYNLQQICSKWLQDITRGVTIKDNSIKNIFDNYCIIKLIQGGTVKKEAII